MNRGTWNALLIGGSTLAGGVAGSWATARAVTNFGCQLGPWGIVVGGVLGALIGSALAGGPPAPSRSEPNTA